MKAARGRCCALSSRSCSNGAPASSLRTPLSTLATMHCKTPQTSGDTTALCLSSSVPRHLSFPVWPCNHGMMLLRTAARLVLHADAQQCGQPAFETRSSARSPRLLLLSKARPETSTGGWATSRAPAITGRPVSRPACKEQAVSHRTSVRTTLCSTRKFMEISTRKTTIRCVPLLQIQLLEDAQQEVIAEGANADLGCL